MQSAVDSNQDAIRVRPTNLQALSPQDSALVEAGKSLVTRSVTIGRDFAKTMAPVCTAAITLYFAALKAIAPNKSQFTVWDGALILVPSLAFLLASVAFILAYVPRLSAVSLNIVTELSQAIDALIERQHRWNRLGLWIFLLATLLSVCGMMNAMLFWQLPPSK
jgi:hypothetical protein